MFQLVIPFQLELPFPEPPKDLPIERRSGRERRIETREGHDRRLAKAS